MKFYLPTLKHLVIHLAKLQIYTLNLTTTFWHCKKKSHYFWTGVYNDFSSYSWCHLMWLYLTPTRSKLSWRPEWITMVKTNTQMSLISLMQHIVFHSIIFATNRNRMFCMGTDSGADIRKSMTIKKLTQCQLPEVQFQEHHWKGCIIW